MSDIIKHGTCDRCGSVCNDNLTQAGRDWICNECCKRTPEQGHTKRCFARALICAIENARDDENYSDIDFALAAQENFRYTALDYYDGLLDCICPPFVLNP